MPIRKMTLTALLIAIGVLSAHLIAIPVGASRCFPVQSALNILIAAWLGLSYSVSSAFLISTLRFLLGTGSLLAFPGSLFGDFLAGYAYKKTKKIGWAIAGEVVGTGIIGSLVSVPIATTFLGVPALGAFFFVLPFALSSIGGGIIAWFLYKTPLTKYISQSFNSN